MIKKLIIFVFGPPGSGKGTYASKLSSKLCLPHVSMGDLVRDEIKNATDIGKDISGYIRSGQLAPDDTIFRILQNRIVKSDCERGYILDGFPRTINQAKTLDKIISPHFVFNLNVPENLIIERLSARLVCKKCGATFNERFMKPKVNRVCDECGSGLYRREDDNPEVIRDRLKIYRLQTEPVLDYYLKRGLVSNISNREVDIPPEKIVDKIMKIINTKINKSNSTQL